MSRYFFLIISFACQVAHANEMFEAPPTEYVVSGNDIYGDHAYEIRAELDTRKGTTKIKELVVKVYDLSISIPPDLLDKIVNPDFGSILVVNDAGVFGSVFYIEIPFGEIGKCSTAKKDKSRRTLHISSLGSTDDKGLSAKLTDPCKK